MNIEKLLWTYGFMGLWVSPFEFRERSMLERSVLLAIFS